MRRWAQRSTALLAVMAAMRGIGEGSEFQPNWPGSFIGWSVPIVVVITAWRWDRLVDPRDPARSWELAAPGLVVPPRPSRLRPRDRPRRRFA